VISSPHRGGPWGLLLKPHGLEGVVSCLVELDLADLPLTQRPEGHAGSLDRDSTSSASSPHTPHGNDCVGRSSISSTGIEAALLEILVAALHKGTTCRVTVVDGRIRSIRLRVVDLHLRMHVPQHPVDVLVAVAAKHTADNLHVLLRHRLLRQACRCQTLSAVPVELDAGDLAVSHGPDGRAQERHLDIAALGAGLVARQHYTRPWPASITSSTPA